MLSAPYVCAPNPDCPRLACRAIDRLDDPRPACNSTPDLATTCESQPRLACHYWPSRTKPFPVVPRLPFLARSDLALPDHVRPRLACNSQPGQSPRIQDVTHRVTPCLLIRAVPDGRLVGLLQCSTSH